MSRILRKFNDRKYNGTIVMSKSDNRAETAIVTANSRPPVRKRAAFLFGQVLSTIAANRAKSVESGELVGSTRLIDRLIRNGIRASAIRERDHRRIRDMHRAYWSSQATDYAFRFENNSWRPMLHSSKTSTRLLRQCQFNRSWKWVVVTDWFYSI